MVQKSVLGGLVLACVSLAWGGVTTACSCGSSDSSGDKRAVEGEDAGGILVTPEGGGGIGDLSITPTELEITVDPAAGAPAPVPFTVGGAGSETVIWHVTNPAVGTVDSHGVFTPTGQAGGVVEVHATVGDSTVKAEVTVIISHRENGGDTSGSTDPGYGGLGGVGGEGFGGALTDDLITILEGTPEADASLGGLYPYDNTVFPLGVLPPLFQWSAGAGGNFEAVSVHLSAPPYYDYKGFFARPPSLDAAANFVRHPVPKEVWAAATRTAAGGVLSVELVLAAGGKAYGPIRHNYKIALAPINGKVYYQAYNTALAHNYTAATVSGLPMGGATLSITIGQESPELVAGRTTDDLTGCRVCHSVSAYGDRMVVQHGDDYPETSSIDLKNGNLESTPYDPGIFGWAGLYPDGTLGVANSVDMGGPNQMNGTVGLFDMNTGAEVPSTGLKDIATRIGLPMFSPDGKHIAFTHMEGPDTPGIGTPNGRQLVHMDFDRTTSAFSAPRLLWETSATDERPAWATFMPTSVAVVFQRRWQGTSDELFATRSGARGELWWIDVATGTANVLDQTNGVGADGQAYVPRGPNGHDADERLNYEPSISPVASGGYAWMVFMSRRQYGNVATADPFHSDPREYNIETDTTTKKLWMAAIDLDAEPGTDPSHPAFYIPGQELRGVNSRPFFALQPCISDRGTCSTGVDCCTGFCRDGYCSPPPVNECSQIDERCTTAADCCPGQRTPRCVGGFCAVFLQ